MEQTPNLKRVIVMEELTGEVENLAREMGVKLLQYSTVEVRIQQTLKLTEGYLYEYMS